ncbi:unnamed protein product [Macrosiphum euphorbiae]|uniref:Uncharacterized protein n=1 Tax=Macrosiphum euphorbiae TaxID=13131 RepID=A0AAV0W7D1_9HEMI|nr:unnamed protein product [Macrosiphum euphorbiae]
MGHNHYRKREQSTGCHMVCGLPASSVAVNLCGPFVYNLDVIDPFRKNIDLRCPKHLFYKSDVRCCCGSYDYVSKCVNRRSCCSNLKISRGDRENIT